MEPRRGRLSQPQDVWRAPSCHKINNFGWDDQILTNCCSSLDPAPSPPDHKVSWPSGEDTANKSPEKNHCKPAIAHPPKIHLCAKTEPALPLLTSSPPTLASVWKFLKCEHMSGSLFRSTIVQRSQSDDLERLSSEEGFCFFFFFFTDFICGLLASFSLPICFLLFFFFLVCSFISFALPSPSILGFLALTSWNKYNCQVSNWSYVKFRS